MAPEARRERGEIRDFIRKCPKFREQRCLLHARCKVLEAYDPTDPPSYMLMKAFPLWYTVMSPSELILTASP